MRIPDFKSRMKPRALVMLALLFMVALSLISVGLSTALAEGCTIGADFVIVCSENCHLNPAAIDDVATNFYTCREDDSPDCGKNPYLWNPIGQHYQRKFAEACYFVTWDENEKLYDELWFDQTPLGQ